MSKQPLTRVDPESSGSLNNQRNDKHQQEIQSNGLQQYQNLYDEVDYSGDDEDDIVQNILAESFLTEPAVYGARSLSVTPQPKDPKQDEKPSGSYESLKSTNNDTKQISSNGCSTSQKQECSSVDSTANKSSSEPVRRVLQAPIPALSDTRTSREGGKTVEAKISRPHSSPVSLSRKASENGHAYRREESSRRYANSPRPGTSESGTNSNGDIGHSERGNASEAIRNGLSQTSAIGEASSRSTNSESNRIPSAAIRDSKLVESSNLSARLHSSSKKVITEPRRRSPRPQSTGSVEVIKRLDRDRNSIPLRPSTAEATVPRKEKATPNEGTRTGLRDGTRSLPKASELITAKEERRDQGRSCNEEGSRSEVADRRPKTEDRRIIPTRPPQMSPKGNVTERSSSLGIRRSSPIKEVPTGPTLATNDQTLSINSGKRDAPLVDRQLDPLKDHLRDDGSRAGFVRAAMPASSCETNTLSAAERKERSVLRSDTTRKTRRTRRRERADGTNARRGQPSSSGGRRVSGANDQPLGVRASSGLNDLTLRVLVQATAAQTANVRVSGGNDEPLGVRTSAANNLPSSSHGQKVIGKSPGVRPSGANQSPLGFRRRSSGSNRKNEDLGDRPLTSPDAETTPSASKVAEAGAPLFTSQAKDAKEHAGKLPAMPDFDIRKIESFPLASSIRLPDRTEPKGTSMEITTTTAMERKQSSGAQSRKRNTEPIDDLQREESSGWAKRMRLAADERQNAILLGSRPLEQSTVTGNKVNESTSHDRTFRVPPGTSTVPLLTGPRPLKNTETSSRDLPANDEQPSKPKNDPSFKSSHPHIALEVRSSRVQVPSSSIPEAASTTLPAGRDARSSTSSRASHPNEPKAGSNAQTCEIGRDTASHEGTPNKAASIKTRLGKRIPPRIPSRRRSFAGDTGNSEKMGRNVELKSDRQSRGHRESLIPQIDTESRQSIPHYVSAQPPLPKAHGQISRDEIKYPETVSRNGVDRQDDERRLACRDKETQETLRKQPSRERSIDQRTRVTPSIPTVPNLSPRSGSGSHVHSRSLYPDDRSLSSKRSEHGRPNQPLAPTQLVSVAEIRQEIPSVIDKRRKVNMDGVPTRPRSMEIPRNVLAPPLRYTRQLGAQTLAQPPHSNMDDIPKQPRNFHQPPNPPSFVPTRASHPGHRSGVNRHRSSLSFEERRHHPYERAPSSGPNQTPPVRTRREFDTRINPASTSRGNDVDERSDVRR